MQEKPIKKVDDFMIDKEDTTRLFCPHCVVPLERVNEGLFCRRCQRTYKVVDGVATFIEKSKYWGEIPQNEMQIINKRIRKEYWKSVLENFSSELVTKKRYFIENLKRANFHFLCNLDSNASVLDVGSGMGTISEALSYYYKRVTAIEPVSERIIFSSNRFKQENIKNVTLIQTDLNHLPFPKRSFDLIILNGVLEWIALYDPNKPPEIVQLEILKKLYELLKSGGILYIGIENRIGITFFFGRVDHNYLSYTSLMPRFIANMITKIKKGYPYRTYTYSLKGYKSLLSRAGFKEIDFFYPYGGYNNPKRIVPLSKKILKTYFSLFMKSKNQIKSGFKKGLALCGGFNWLAPDFAICARKKGIRQINAIERMIRRAITKVGYSKFSNEFSFIVNNTSETHITFIVFINLYQHPFLVVTHSFKKDFNKIIEREYRNLKFIRSLLPEDMRKYIPKPIFIDYIENRAILIKGFVSGKNLEVQMNKKKLVLMLSKIAEWNLEFNKVFGKYEILFEKKKVEELLFIPMKQFSEKNQFDIPENFYVWIEEEIKKYKHYVLLMSPQHGDFWHGNIVESCNRLGVYDWEFFGEVNIPLFDFFHFLTMLLTSPENFAKNRKENFSILFFSIDKFSTIIREKVFEVMGKMEIDEEITTILYFLYLINFYDKISVKFLSQEVTEDMVHFIKRFILMRNNFIFNRD